MRDDLVTGLLDRQSLIDVMVSKVVVGSGGHHGAVVIAVDQFPLINDALGLPAGDALLRAIGGRIRSAIGERGLCGRTGGATFAVFLFDGCDTGSILETLQDLCRRPFLIGGQAVTLACHFGAATSGTDVRTAHDLLHAADLASHASASLAQPAMLYDPSMRAGAQRSFHLAQELRAAVMRDYETLQTARTTDAFSLAFQPKITSATRLLRGFEGLLRWTAPDGTEIAPSEFIPLAERAGLIDILGAWCLRAGCMALARWPEEISLAINVSPAQLHRADWLLATLGDAVTAAGISPHRLQIEITETALNDRAAPVLEQIVARGHRIWLDDFGSGYSTLARLFELPFTGLKVDKSITSRLADGPEGASFRLLAAVSAIATAHGIDSVIEGIETEQQAREACAAGIALLQGYLFAKPMNGEETDAFIRRWIDRLDVSHG